MMQYKYCVFKRKMQSGGSAAAWGADMTGPWISALVLILLGAIAPASAEQSRDWETCRNSDNNDSKISACARIIAQGGKLSGKDRGQAYNHRGNGHFRKGEQEPAL